MLSKSQAKWFFLSVTSGFSLVFLALTVDTLNQIPERTNEAALSEAAIRGRMIWDQNNCMGCHTLLGEGAYYAPELTKVVARRGTPWMRQFLKDPAAMYPHRRQMVQYNFTDPQIDDLVAFFDWIGKIHTNGFPADPPLKALMGTAPASSTSVAALTGAPPIFTQICAACHSVGGTGGNVGPALDGVAQRKNPTELDAWLADPSSVKPGTAMPNLNLSASDRQGLVSWLSTLK